MSTDKGKGKRKGKGKSSANEENTIFQEDGNPSMIARIAASANGLTRNIIAGPNNNESLAINLSNSGKSQPSSGSGSTYSAWVEASTTSRPHAPNELAGVKTGHSAEHERANEQEFAAFLDGIDVLTPGEPSGTMGADPYKDIGSTWGQAWAHAQTVETPEPVIPAVPNRTVAEQEAQDGQEVLGLLSSPGWISNEYEALHEDQAPEDYDWGLSEEQISQIKVMKQHLGDERSYVEADVNHPLNLVPELDAKGRQQWIDQWEGVLTRYSDEVWGRLLPLVQEARQEVEDVRQQSTLTEKPTAVRRLEAILGHLQRR